MPESELLISYIHILLIALAAAAFAVGSVLGSFFLGKKKPSPAKNMPYECGMEPIGSAWIRFGIVYYLYALIFLTFDVDVLFLFPVAVAYNSPEFVIRDLVEVLIFVGILCLAVVYAWVKGAFKWEQKTYLHQ